ncbi:MAG: hypothetical protein QXW01_02725, partial [Candidatus Aenigmatarchaeota archaeon]
MDNKRVLILLALLIITIFKFSELAISCQLVSGNDFFIDSSCTDYTTSYYWSTRNRLAPGCEMGYIYGDVYVEEHIGRGAYICKKISRLHKDYGINGEGCEVRWGSYCNYNFTGKYDASTQRCAKCEGNVKTKLYFCEANSGNYEEVFQCESACGADACCDDVAPNNYIRKTNCKGYCSPDCSFTAWSISINANTTLTTIGKAVRITATTNLNLPSNYYIYIYENGLSIKSCSSGNTCSVDVVKNVSQNFNYNAKVVSA